MTKIGSLEANSLQSKTINYFSHSATRKNSLDIIMEDFEGNHE